MSKKLLDFVSSFGVMLLGVGLLFVGSVNTASSGGVKVFEQNLPIVGAHIAHLAQQTGGDIVMPALLPPRPTVPLPVNPEQFSQSLTAISALVVDEKTDTIFFAKNAQEVRSLASITKLMSALVLVDLPLDWATTTVITVADQDSSSHHINVGERFTLDDLWHVALIGSSNSAIQVLVRATGLDEAAFASLMNKKAQDLNLDSMRFTEPTGLDSGNVGTAEDTVKLLKAALRVRKIADTLSIAEYYDHPIGQAKPRRVWSTDWLLTNWVPNDFNKEDIVGKTGFIENSGYNFVVRLTDSAKHAVRVVILGAASNEQRFSEARDLAEWSFAHYRWPDQTDYDKLAQ